MIRTDLCDCSDAYIFVSGTITITEEGDNDAEKKADQKNKRVVFKNHAPFNECLSNINNTQIDHAKDTDVVTLMYNLMEYSDNYSKRSGSLWQYYSDNSNDNITESESFKSKIKIEGKTADNDNTKNAEIVVLLKYLNNFWRTPEIPLINCEIVLDITWSKKCVISSAVGKTEFSITDTKLCVPVVTLSTEDNVKLLKQLNLVLKEKLIVINFSLNQKRYHKIDI